MRLDASAKEPSGGQLGYPVRQQVHAKVWDQVFHLVDDGVMWQARIQVRSQMSNPVQEQMQGSVCREVRQQVWEENN